MMRGRRADAWRQIGTQSDSAVIPGPSNPSLLYGMVTICGGVAGPAPHALLALTLST
jgi:hypothetical protein